MSEAAEDIAESEWRDAFRAGIREAQGERTDKDMAYLLGISHDRYRKYVSGGPSRKTVLPVRYLTKFCKITAKRLTWLIDGEEEAKQKPPPTPKAKKAPAKRQSA